MAVAVTVAVVVPALFNRQEQALEMRAAWEFGPHCDA